jgi:rhomboid family GlyGly-CTERM serine protease
MIQACVGCVEQASYGVAKMTRSSSLTLSVARPLPGASLILVAFAVAVSVLPGAADCLQYDRLAIADGALWRIVTAHFVHWSGEHLIWDGLALGVLGWLCEREGAGRFLACVAVSAITISAILWFSEPGMATYRGLSGIDSALFAMLATRILCDAAAERDWLRIGLTGLVAVGFAAKVGFEMASGATLFVDSLSAGMTPVPLAHVVGGAIGLFLGLRVPGGRTEQGMVGHGNTRVRVAHHRTAHRRLRGR